MNKYLKHIRLIIPIVGATLGIISFTYNLSEPLFFHYAVDALMIVFTLLILFLTGRWLWMTYYLKARWFKTSTHSRFNRQFYSYFGKVIKNARKEFYTTGDGFDYVDKEGVELAQNYIQDLEQALKNGVNVVRIQTKKDISAEWKKNLKFLLEYYPNYFKLYLLKDFHHHSIALMSVTDPQDKKRNHTQVMLPISQHIMDVKVNLAGIAFFLKGDKELAQNMQQRFNELLNISTPIVLSTFEQFFSQKRYYYFAYGSNMDEKQIQKRCPSAVKVGIGFKEQYQLVFNRKGTRNDRTNGVASIEPSSQEIGVYGVIYSLTKEDLQQLDKEEHVPTSYIRDVMNILYLEYDNHQLNKKNINCQVYLAIREKDTPPDGVYLNQIIVAAKVANLPKRYILYLENFKQKV